MQSDEWKGHMPWIRQYLAMRMMLGATCLNCHYDFHVDPGTKPWVVLREPCAEHHYLRDDTVKSPDAPSTQ